MSDAVLDGPDAIREHLEIAVEPDERSRRCVRFVLCDAQNRVLVHCPVEDIPAESDPDDCEQTVSVFATALTGVGNDGAMLVVLTRPGSSSVIDADRRWFRAAHAVCAEYGVRLLGVHLMTRRRQREIVLDDAL